MKLVYTEQALASLNESLELIAPKVSHEKFIEIRDRILDQADTLLLQPLKGQKEPFLEHLGLGHRRLLKAITRSFTGLKVSIFMLQIFLIPGKILIK